jgi:hypothetical protein
MDLTSYAVPFAGARASRFRSEARQSTCPDDPGGPRGIGGPGVLADVIEPGGLDQL